ncbi:MAG: hypothetical protein QOE35_1950 [Actinomycetota bacterium]|jgi:hypothetical protein
MSQGRRLTALAAVAFIGVAGVLAAAQSVRDMSDVQSRFVASPVVVAAQGALRPVEGRPLELWGKTTRRADRSVGDPAARTLALATVLLAVSLAATAHDSRRRVAGRGAAQERAPPLPLVH